MTEMIEPADHPATTETSAATSGEMNRRDLLMGGAALGLGTLAGTGSAAALPAAGAKPLTRAETDGLRQSVCRWCYNKIPLEELAKAAKEMGLESVEIIGPDDFPVLQKHDLICGMVNSHGITKGVNRPEHHDACLEAIRRSIDAASEAGYPNVITFSGNRDGMSDEEGLDHCLTAMQKIAPYAEKKKVTVCMEVLNSKLNHPDYMADHTAWGVELVKRVGSERFKLLYDIYHMQIMEGDVIRTILDNHEYIAHYHTAGVPGRHEIDETQELYYPAIVRAIRSTGYKGLLAQEFIPKGDDPLAALRDGVRICDV